MTSGSAVGGSVRLEFPARPEYLALVRVVVGRVAGHGPPLDPLRINDLCLAVSEACANAIDAYADEGDVGARVDVQLALGRRQITVDVNDRAGGFEIGAVRPSLPEPHPHRERGLGLPLMRTLTDEMVVTPTDGGTSVRLVMRGGAGR
jgi:anti-sigma regulatory factor (Ser/Thr protein kinase)